MTERRSLSRMQRLRVFEAAGGICYLCGLTIKVGKKWEVEHVQPLGLLGVDEPSNMLPAHKACHAEKTSKDVADIARAKRRKAKHHGIRQSGNPMPGSKRSKWRRKVNGEVVLR